MLIDNAARKWGVPVEEVTTEPNMVVHAKSGRKLSYGDIAAFAEVPAKAPEIKPEQLKKTSEFRLIGKDVMRVELPKKVNGSAQYGIDIQVPGMLYGMVLRAPVEGSVPDKIDEAKVRAVPGVTAVVRLPHGVGVVADTAWAASGRQILNNAVTWTRTGRPGASTARRLTMNLRPMPRTYACRRVIGLLRAMPAVHSRTRRALSKVSIAATMPITHRWSR